VTGTLEVALQLLDQQPDAALPAGAASTTNSQLGSPSGLRFSTTVAVVPLSRCFFHIASFALRGIDVRSHPRELRPELTLAKSSSWEPPQWNEAWSPTCDQP